MKILKGADAENLIKEKGYGKVSKKFLEKMFVVEDFVDGWEEKVTVQEYYTFMVNCISEDAFLDDIYENQDCVSLGIQELVSFGISNLTIKVDNQDNIYIV